MSPHQALHDPVFRAYVWIILGSLAAGGIVLGLVQWGLKKELGPIWSTYRSWLVLAPIGMAVIFAGRVPTIIGVTSSLFSDSRNLRAPPDCIATGG